MKLFWRHFSVPVFFLSTPETSSFGGTNCFLCPFYRKEVCGASPCTQNPTDFWTCRPIWVKRGRWGLQEAILFLHVLCKGLQRRDTPHSPLLLLWGCYTIYLLYDSHRWSLSLCSMGKQMPSISFPLFFVTPWTEKLFSQLRGQPAFIGQPRLLRTLSMPYVGKGNHSRLICFCVARCLSYISVFTQGWEQLFPVEMKALQKCLS